jgi:Flp pilus assembly pilin Flp
MGRKDNLNNKGQHLIEYAIIVALIASAMIAMSTYVFRSVQATQQVIQRGYTD